MKRGAADHGPPRQVWFFRLFAGGLIEALCRLLAEAAGQRFFRLFAGGLIEAAPRSGGAGPCIPEFFRLFAGGLIEAMRRSFRSTGAQGGFSASLQAASLKLRPCA